MRIKLTTSISKNEEDGCLIGREFDAILVAPRSTTVEFVNDAGKRFRAFHYEYELADGVGSEESTNI